MKGREALAVLLTVYVLVDSAVQENHLKRTFFKHHQRRHLATKNRLRHRHHGNASVKAERRDSLGFLKSFTEENLHLSKLFKHKLDERHLKAPAKNIAPKTPVWRRQKLHETSVDISDDDDTGFDDDEIAVMNQKQHKNFVASTDRIHHTKDYEVDDGTLPSQRYVDKSNPEQNEEQLKSKGDKVTFDSLDVDLQDGVESSGELDQEASAMSSAISSGDRPVVPNHQSLALKISSEDARISKNQAHNVSAVTDLYPNIPMPPMIPIPLFYSSGDQEEASSASTSIETKVVGQIEDGTGGESGNGEAVVRAHKQKKVEPSSGDWVDRLLADEKHNQYDDDDFDEEEHEAKHSVASLPNKTQNESQTHTSAETAELPNDSKVSSSEIANYNTGNKLTTTTQQTANAYEGKAKAIANTYNAYNPMANKNNAFYQTYKPQQANPYIPPIHPFVQPIKPLVQQSAPIQPQIPDFYQKPVFQQYRTNQAVVQSSTQIIPPNPAAQLKETNIQPSQPTLPQQNNVAQNKFMANPLSSLPLEGNDLTKNTLLGNKLLPSKQPSIVLPQATVAVKEPEIKVQPQNSYLQNNENMNALQNGYSTQIALPDLFTCMASCSPSCAPACEETCCSKSVVEPTPTQQQSFAQASTLAQSTISAIDEASRFAGLPIGASPIIPNNDKVMTKPSFFPEQSSKNKVIDNQPVATIKNWLANTVNSDAFNPLTNQKQAGFEVPVQEISTPTDQAQYTSFVTNNNNKVASNIELAAFSNNIMKNDIQTLQKNDDKQQVAFSSSTNNMGPNELLSPKMVEKQPQKPAFLTNMFSAVPQAPPAMAPKNAGFALQPFKPWQVAVPSFTVVHLRKEAKQENDLNAVKYPNPACFKTCQSSCLPHCSNYCCSVTTRRNSIEKRNFIRMKV